MKSVKAWAAGLVTGLAIGLTIGWGWAWSQVFDRRENAQ